MTVFDRGALLAMGIVVLGFAGPAGAQENLDSGKSAAQLFASDCAICHKTPQGLAKANGLSGLDNFLREHYTASRESAVAIARYLQTMDKGPAAPSRAAKRTAKGKATEKKPESGKAGAAKDGEIKSGEKPGEAKVAEPEPKAEPKPEAKPETKPEPKAAEPAETPKAN